MAKRYQTLADYFKRTGQSKRALAKELGVSESYISFISAGKRQPSLALALRIESITGVPAASLVPEAAA